MKFNDQPTQYLMTKLQKKLFIKKIIKKTQDNPG
jgi:hypothetical protein